MSFYWGEGQYGGPQEVRVNHLYPTPEEVATLATSFPNTIYFTSEEEEGE